MLGFFCLFVYLSELIEELARYENWHVVSNDESRIKLENLSEIFTPLQKKWRTIFHTFSIQYYVRLHSHNRNHYTTMKIMLETSFQRLTRGF